MRMHGDYLIVVLHTSWLALNQELARSLDIMKKASLLDPTACCSYCFLVHKVACNLNTWPRYQRTICPDIYIDRQWL